MYQKKQWLNSIRQKVTDNRQLQNILSDWRSSGEKIVFTNGCFDILHYGHLQLLTQAADLGDKLIVGLNSDSSVRQLKGNSRPVNSQNSRSLLLASFEFVDAVILFEDQTPYELIRNIEPDVLVKGGDYTPETVVGADIVKAKNGQVVIIHLEEGFSTSGIIEEIGL